MDIYTTIEKRQTIRKYSNKPIPEETVRKILDAGLKAPSCNHLREWEFILLKDLKTREAVIYADGVEDVTDAAKLSSANSMQDPNARLMYIEANAVQKSMVYTAPEVLIVCYKLKNRVKDCTHINEMNYLAAAWCCIENILLAMAAEGIYGVTRIPYKPDQLRKVLNIPEDYEIAAVIPFGYPAEDAVRCKQNPVNVEEKIHIDKW